MHYSSLLRDHLRGMEVLCAKNTKRDENSNHILEKLTWFDENREGRSNCGEFLYSDINAHPHYRSRQCYTLI